MSKEDIYYMLLTTIQFGDDESYNLNRKFDSLIGEEFANTLSKEEKVFLESYVDGLLNDRRK